jgi:aspartate/methionine/tyrosine aminotransferase
MTLADRWISNRSRRISGSGIRKVVADARATPGAITLHMGQPDFPVPQPIRDAAIAAIATGAPATNGYTDTRGYGPLLQRTREHLINDVAWDVATEPHEKKAHAALITSGTSGGLMLAALAILDPGDEMIIPDPYFVVYPKLGELFGSSAVACDTYPDFRLTAERVEPLITPRTKAVLLCSPGNPSGVVSSKRECQDLLDLCKRRNLLLISDEIYDEFTFDDFKSDKRRGDGSAVCPSPARLTGGEEHVLLIRGFGKTYGCTGWRLGYVAGPKAIVDEMVKMQQYSYVCAPTPLQAGVVASFGLDMSKEIAEYRRRRDLVVGELSKVTEVAKPGGAFYVFAKAPGNEPDAASRFYERCRAEKVFIVPGDAFSTRNSHFRLSYATSEENLMRGLETIVRLMKSGER